MSHYIRLAQDKYDGKLPIRLNLCAEELGNIGKSIPNLDHFMTAGRSRNIRCQLVLQNISQLNTLYGESKASTILSNADVMMMFRTNHWETLTEFSNKCGEIECEKDHIPHNEKLILPERLGAMENGQALVMISGRTKFITYLPDFTEMFDCSVQKVPERTVRELTPLPPMFNIQRYIRKYNEKAREELEEKMRERDRQRLSESLRSPFVTQEKPDFTVDKLLARINDRLEEEESKAKEQENQSNCVTVIELPENKTRAVTAIRLHTDMPIGIIRSAVESLPHTFTFKTAEDALEVKEIISDLGGVVIADIKED